MRWPTLLAPIALVATAIDQPPAAGAEASPARQVIYAAYYQPDAFEYAGQAILYVRDPSAKPLTITRVEMDGESIGPIRLTDQSFLAPGVRDEYVAVANDNVAWYRVFPNPVPRGGMAEVVVRLAPKACQTESHEFTIHFDRRDPLSIGVPLAAPGFALDYVGIEPGLEALHVYATGPRRRARAGAGAAPAQVEIDARPAKTEIHRVSSRWLYAKVTLGRAWERGSFHTVALLVGGQRLATTIRALPTPPPIGIMGNLNSWVAQEYASHLFDAHLAFVPGRDALYDTLEQHGLRGAYIYYRRLKPGEAKYEPVYYDQPGAIGAHRKRASLWAYFLEDEPDGRYHVTALPALSISRDVERANEFCRILDRRHPTYLQIDHGGFPRGVYLYGAVPDYICAHAYRTGTSEVVGATKAHVDHLRAGSRPHPFYYLNCGYSTNGAREFGPDEMRLEVLTALARGAKSFQWYPAHGDRGLLKHPRMWNAVGEMNGILHQVLPLTSIGTPVGEPRVDSEKILGSTILCGDKAMVVVLVNLDFEAGPEAFRLTPTEDVSVRVRLPQFMKVRGVCSVAFPGKTGNVPATIHGSTVTFSLDVAAGAIAVVYADPSVPARLGKTRARCLRAFQPVAEE